jgi:hypothetical protein
MEQVLSVLGVMRDPAEGDKTIKMMDHSGDKKTVWNPKNKDETDMAREEFNKLKKKGFLAFAVKKGEKGKQVHEFEDVEDAGELIMAPPVVGG